MTTTWSEHQSAIEGSHIFYRAIGEGDPWVFLHGMPVSSHVWQPVMHEVASLGRLLAPDMIGMGRSGKPDIAYTIDDHMHYLHAWFDAMDLHNITLVLHGWGSLVGLAYARKYPERIAKLVLFEAYLQPRVAWDMLSLPVQQLHHLMRRQSLLERQILDENFMIETFLPGAFLGDLSESDWQAYRAPFDTPESRRVLLQYVRDLPLGVKRTKAVPILEANSDYLTQSDVPKCLLYAMPGFITPISTVVWAKANLSHLSCVDLGHGFHFAQASNPDAFAHALLSWSMQLERQQKAG